MLDTNGGNHVHLCWWVCAVDCSGEPLLWRSRLLFCLEVFREQGEAEVRGGDSDPFLPEFGKVRAVLLSSLADVLVCRSTL